MVVAYQPAVSVKLLKMVQRTQGAAARYAAADRTVDLTPYLGDAGVVRTQKSLTEPCGGFSITFADKMEPKAQDSLYALIEPMDLIEIRAARNAYQNVGGPLPLIMRGWVSSIRRSEAIGNDGTPQRVVIVTGQDSGKLLQIEAIWWEVVMATNQQALTEFKMSNVFNMAVGVYTLSNFTRAVVDKILNPKIALVAGVAQRAVPPMTVNATVAATEGSIIPNSIFSYSGNVLNLIAQFADRPWNELFVEDTEAGPVLNLRPTPFHGLDGQLLKDGSGNLLMTGAVEPDVVSIDDASIVSIDLSRTDANIANFFWVPPGQSMLATGMALDTAALIAGQPLDFNYSNNNPALYGQRKMTMETHLRPSNVTTLPAASTAGQQAAYDQAFAEWHLRRSGQLKFMNRDNGVFEQGSTVLRGSEYLKIGRYLRVHRGQLAFEVYIDAVGHTIMPFGTWTSSLGVSRGTGFLERIKLRPSPYIAEGQPGVYPMIS